MSLTKIWMGSLILTFALFVVVTEANAQGMHLNKNGAWVNERGGNIYGDSRYNANANPRFNPMADPRFNPMANPNFNVNADPNFNANANPGFNPNGVGR
jgi:hypothetical protein